MKKIKANDSASPGKFNIFTPIENLIFSLNKIYL